MVFEFDNLSWSYDLDTPFQKVGLDTAPMSINSGNLVGILGATGSGKSTFVKLVSGLLDSRIRISKNGIKLTRKDVSYVFQQPEHQLFEESVQSELEFALDNYKIPKELWPRLISDSLKSCGLSTSFLNRHPLELSGGQKRRLAIASVLVYQPKLLILDEPLAGLDAHCSKVLIKTMKSYVNSETLVLWVSHDHAALLEWADMAVVFQDQAIKSIGSVPESIALCDVADPLLRDFLTRRLEGSNTLNGREIIQELKVDCNAS